MIHETIKSRGKPKYYCRQRKGVVKVRYLVYLFGCVLLVGGGAVCSVTPSGIRLDVANLLSLLDYTTLAFLLIACVLVLLGNNSFRAFGWAIRAMFQEKKPSAARALESYLAYRQVAIGSLLAGGAGSLLSLIKMMHSLGGGNLEELGIALNVACLSLGYAIFLNLLLLPVGFLLRKTLGEIEQADKVD